MDIIKYKDYEGTAELDMSRNVCRGKLLFIDDVVTYEAEAPSGLQHEFEAAVDDYLDTCKELKREPQRPFKGQFNVRIEPTMHRLAVLRAVADGVFLNDVVICALASYLNTQPQITQNVNITLQTPEKLKTLLTTASENPRWATHLMGSPSGH